MKDFNSDSENLRFTILIGLAIAIIGAILIWHEDAIFYVFGMIYIAILLKPWRFAIKKIDIEGESLLVTKYNYLLGSKSCTFALSKLDFTFRRTNVRGGYNAIGGVITGDVLMLYDDGRLLFDLTPGEHNWNPADIMQVAKNLQAHGVKQLLDKYGSEDVVL